MSIATRSMEEASLLPAGRDALSDRIAAGLFAAAIALGVVACFLWTAREGPLPAGWWAAVVLFLFAQQDVAHLRIPNVLTFPALALALGLGLVTGGGAGLAAALGGAGTALAVLFLPFAIGWLGAGDVKGSMALAGLWGGANFLGALWWMLVVGGVLAIVVLAAQGGLPDLIRRWISSLVLSLCHRRPMYVHADPDGPARAGLPFAVAMGLGASAYQFWGMPW